MWDGDGDNRGDVILYTLYSEYSVYNVYSLYSVYFISLSVLYSLAQCRLFSCDFKTSFEASYKETSYTSPSLDRAAYKVSGR